MLIKFFFSPQEGDFILRVHVERYSREIPENHMTFDLEKGAQLTQSEERLQQQQQHHWAEEAVPGQLQI